MTWQEPFNFHFDPFLLLMDHYGITTRPRALSKVAVPGIEGSPSAQWTVGSAILTGSFSQF